MNSFHKRFVSALCCMILILLSAPVTFSYNEPLPEHYSSEEMGYIRPAENQYDSAGCWAFSSLGVLSAYSVKHGIHSYENADFSEAHLIWFNGKSRTDNPDDPTFGDGIDSDSPYEEGSRKFTSVFALARGSGIEWETNYPFSRRNSDMGNYFEEERYEHAAAILTEAKLLRTTDDIKKAVLDYGAAEAGIYYDESKLFNTAKRKYVNGEYVVTGSCCYFNSEKSGEGHNIMIIGWDDAYPRSNFSADNMPQKNGAWLCKNSWGTAWGENGLFWISYENAAFENVMTYACVDGNTYKDIYQYDGYGFNRRIAASDKKTASAANIFKAKNSLTLEAVGFYTYQNSSDTSCDVKIDIYKNLSSEIGNPVQNSPVLTFPTSVTHDGYHTVKLPNSVAMDAGEAFSVVVAVTACEGNAQMLLEGNPLQSVEYHAEKGCSFVSFGNSQTGFIDTAEKYGGNVCIKAYTNDYAPGSAAGIEINSDDLILTKGSNVKVSAVIKPMGQSGIINWSASDDNIITVDASGILYARGIGKAYLYAECEGKTDSISVTVHPEYYSKNDVIIERNPGEKTVDYGDTLVLHASLSEADTEVFFGWYVNGIKQAECSDTFSLVNITEPAEIIVRLEDENGNTLKNDSEKPIEASEKVKVKKGFIKMLISFLKNLFHADRRKYN